ncbi:alpha/beta hydrolase [Micromonospora sp. CPCC 205371]|nr:alpha/beta hydrolase [Micromonospora sp. CPCC 205371]
MRAQVLTHDVVGEGPPVVLVPGGLTGWVSWIPHAERLAGRWQTIRVQPIHNELGSAGQPGDPAYTAAIERDSLNMTMDALGIETADFAGWSGGGRALLEYAITYPDRVRTLTLIEPAAYWILEQTGEADRDVDDLAGLLHRLAGGTVTEDDLAEFCYRAGLTSTRDEARRHPNWPRWVPHRMALSWQSQRADRPDRSVAELSQIGCPVLLIAGTATAPWLQRVVDVLAERLPNAHVLELPGDHACHIQNIDAFLKAFEDHIAHVSRSS